MEKWCWQKLDNKNWRLGNLRDENEKQEYRIRNIEQKYENDSDTDEENVNEDKWRQWQHERSIQQQ